VPFLKNTNENIEDFQAHQEESEEKKDNETESEETESEVEKVGLELSIDDNTISSSLDSE
jgi:ribosomal protein L9